MKYTYLTLLFFLQFNLGLGQPPRLVLPFGHTGIVTMASFSPDGKMVATASWDYTVKVWQADIGKLLYTIVGHTFEVNSVQFSKDGKRILTSSRDGTAKIWDTHDGSIIKTMENVQFAKYSEDGNLMVTISDYKNAKVWNAVTGELIKSLNHKTELTLLSLNKANNLLLSQGKDSIIYVWDWKKNELKYQISDGSMFIRSAEFSDQGNYILTSSSDNYLRIWDAKNGKLIKSYLTQEPIIYGLMKESENKLFVLSYNNIFSTIGVEDGKLNKELALSQHKDVITRFEFNKEGTKFVTACQDHSAMIWNYKNGAMLVKLGTWINPIRSVCVSKNNKMLVTSGSNYTQILDSKTGKLLNILVGHKGEITSSIFSPNFDVVLTTSYDKTAKVWNPNNGKLLYTLVGHTSRITTGCFSPNGDKIITDSDDGTARVWNAKTGDFLYMVEKNGILMSKVSFNANGEMFLTSSYGNKPKIWNTKRGTLVYGFQNINEVIYSAIFLENSKVVLQTQREQIMIWDIEKREFIHELKDSMEFKDVNIRDKYGESIKGVTAVSSIPGNNFIYSVEAVTISNDCQKIATSSCNGIKVWNAKNGQLIYTIKKNFPPAYYLEFNKNVEKILAIESNRIRVIDAVERGTRGSFNGLYSRVEQANFINDGQMVITVNNEGVKTWETRTGKNIATYLPINGVNNFTQIPTGFYQCSPNAAKLLHYVTKDLKVISFEQLDIKYNRPDKVLEALGNEDTSLIKSYRNAYLKRIKKLGIDTTTFKDDYSVPECDVVNREQIEYDQKDELINLHIKGNDDLYKLDRFNIWINEVPLLGQRGISIRKQNRDGLDTTITIKLSQGINNIEASIINYNGTESYHMPLVVNYVPSKPPIEKLVFIGIGIDNFVNPKYNLQYSVKDIRDLAKLFKTKYGNSILIDTFFNEQVTTSNIKSIKAKLLKTSIHDKVIIAYSGHGVLTKEFDYYLSTYDVDFENASKNGLSYDDLEWLIDSIPARKKLLLIDACHSGEVDKEELAMLVKVKEELDPGSKGSTILVDTSKKTLSTKSSFELMQNMFVNINKGTGAAIISASGGTQFALERGDLKNGVFTYSILEAFKNNSKLKISELKKLVEDRVVELTKGMQKPTTRNETINSDWDVW